MIKNQARLRPGDIEIEFNHAGPIIHIFPEETPEDTLREIGEGIYLKSFILNLMDSSKVYLEETDDPNLKITFETIRKEMEKALVGASNYTEEFIKSVKK